MAAHSAPERIYRRFSGARKDVAAYIAELMTSGGNPIVAALHSFPLPSICAVNGVAAGGGVGLALAADIVIAARSPYIYLPFAPVLNLVPDLGAACALARKVGRARALGLALTGQKLSAEQAEQWGLIWKSVPDESLELEGMALAQSLAAMPRDATSAVRDLVDRASGAEFEPHLTEEARHQRRLAGTNAFREAISAFIEKRKPSF
jgi:2-(1,2-epoxy-1,2-dihydrophenyl)acetyl-CoA isomerase